jgi:hypothetical protein
MADTNWFDGVDTENMATIPDLQGLLFLGAGQLSQSFNLPSTILGLFEITYRASNFQANTQSSEYKIPLGATFTKHVYNEPITFSLQDVQFKNIFTQQFDLGLAKNNFGLVLLQALRMVQTKIPLLINTTEFTGTYLITSFSSVNNGGNRRFTINFKQATLFQEASNLKFEGTSSTDTNNGGFRYLEHR